MNIMGKWYIAFAHHSNGPSVDICVGTIKDCMDTIINELQFLAMGTTTTHFTITDQQLGADIITVTLNKA